MDRQRPGWLGLLLRSADDVLAIHSVRTPLKVGVAGPHPAGSPAAYEVRAFFPEGDTSVEDPVTGSLNASMAQWLVGSGRITPPYCVSQGTALGRAGVVHVTADATGQLWIGGAVTTCVDGRVTL